MVYDPKKHHRRSIRVKGYDYSSEGWYYITLCTQNRIFLFDDVKNGKMILNKYGRIVDSIWNKLPDRYPINIDEYVIMLNHFHGIINVGANKVGVIHESPQRDTPDIKVRRKMLLPKVIGYFKMNTAKKINLLRKTTGTSIWQRDYYEHIIRDEKDLNRVRRYIVNNPGKWQDDKYYN